MDCSSPTSAKKSSNTATRDSGPTGTGTPHCESAEMSPTAFRSTVLPPVFGPETSSVCSSGSSTSSNGTTSTPCARSSGCRDRRRANPSCGCDSSAGSQSNSRPYLARA